MEEQGRARIEREIELCWTLRAIVDAARESAEVELAWLEHDLARMTGRAGVLVTWPPAAVEAMRRRRMVAMLRYVGSGCA
jgi:hypothetical protein